MQTDLKFTLRRIFKNKLGTIINTIGLTIGIFVCIVLLNFFIQESTYDHHHTKSDRIFKVYTQVAFNPGSTGTYGITLGTLAKDYREKFPQVENTARLYGPHNIEMDIDQDRFNNTRVLQVDYAFFELFDFPGVSKEAFNSPSSAVISQQFAERLNDINPIGKQIEIEGITYIIQAVTDIPYSTVFQFDVALPVAGDPHFKQLESGGMEIETYVLLNENVDQESTTEQLRQHYSEVLSSRWPMYESDSYLLPLKEVYLDNRAQNRMGNGNKQVLVIILTIALLVLGLAIINYINLQIANNHSRTPEFRIKKIMGAGKNVLLKQGMIESLFIIGTSGVLAIILLDLFYTSGASTLIGKDILTISKWSFSYWLIYVASLLVIGTIAGAVPSIKLFKLKSITQQELKQKKLGKLTISLVIFQFFVTTSLLTTILFVNFQMNFLKNQPTGYDSDQVVMINNLNDDHKDAYQQIKTQLEQFSGILSVAGSQNAPGSGASGQFVHREGQSEDDGISIAHIRTINGYAQTLDLEFVSGSDFTITTLGGETQFILNETAANKLFADGTNPIGQIINMSERVGKVVGVVKDFHYLSFHYQVSPLAINIEEPYNLTLMVKIAPESVQGSLSEIENVLAAIDPMYVFDYQFLDDQFDRSYRKELRAQTIISYATLVAFSISILGLLALSIFVINSKIKEIAIRKALGGSQAHIFGKLSYQLVSWIVIGNLLSIPISYLIAESWVQDFVYQVNLSNLLWMSPASTVVTLIVAMTAITRKLYKTMVINPVEFLRNE